MSLDKKFRFLAINPCTGRIVSENEGVVFLAKDNAFPKTLRFYREECERLGAEEVQLKGIDLLIERVDAWRDENADLCKVPDANDCEARTIL